MLKVSDKYVKSYRFLEAYDDPLELMSSVKLEVNLFQEAINRALSTNGIFGRTRRGRAGYNSYKRE